MKIAILGWSLLVWESDTNQARGFVIKGDWNTDGPELPIEFLRRSLDGRILLVIHPGSKPVTTLWAESGFDYLNQAIGNLRKREGTIEENIGFLDLTTSRRRTKFPSIISTIKAWALAKGFDGVIWTEFKPNITERDGTLEGIKNLIHQSSSVEQESIKSYVLSTPVQIQTDYRDYLQDYLENEL